MKLYKSLFFCFLNIILQDVINAQTPILPVRIEKKTAKYTETNSKYGARVITKHRLELIYQDSTSSILTCEKLKILVKPIPEAQAEWQKYHRSRLSKTASLPLLAIGFVGSTQYFMNETNKQRNALIALLGISGGLKILIHFNRKEQRHENMVIAYCNRHWLTKKLPSDY
jgi:hypothetical protein